MKKWILCAALLLNSALAFADNQHAPERIETLSAKVILQSTNGYFVFSDRSCWKAVAFSKRWRSLSEWWNGVELAPEKYDCVPDNWVLGTEIEVYSKFGNMDVDDANAANQELLKQCTHLLLNKRTGQVLFAIKMEPTECIISLHKEAYQDGYAQGYAQGQSGSYTRGRDDGYRAGYTAGFQAAQVGQQRQQQNNNQLQNNQQRQ